MSERKQRIANLSAEGLSLLLARHKQEQRSQLLAPTPRQDRNGLPLSFVQERLWFLEHLVPGSPRYIIPFSLHLRGAVQVRVLANSLAEIVRRHEILRTTFPYAHGQVEQHIASGEHIPQDMLAQIDLHTLQEEQRQDEIQRLTLEEASRPFDLAHDFPLRATLVRGAPREYVLLVSVHHIAFDGWSLALLIRELFTLYAAGVQGKAPDLPDLPVQYADFALWQRHWLQGERGAEQLRYWCDQLAGLSTLQLPVDHPRPLLESFQGERCSTLLPAALTWQLKALSQREHATLFMTLLAAFQVLLARYSGQEDIAVGTAISNRTRSEFEGLIGCFANTVVLRTDLSANPPFQEILRRARETTLQAYTQQDLPFEQLIQALHPERVLGHAPLFQVLFSLQSMPSIPEETGGLLVDLVPGETHTSKFDLTFSIIDEPQGLRCSLEYKRDLFEAEAIVYLLARWQLLLEGIVAHPGQHIGHFPLLSAAEWQQVIRERNATWREHTEDLCLHHYVEQHARLIPDALAVSFEDTQLSYFELNRQAERLATSLSSRGLRAGAIAGICLHRSLAAIIAMLGVLKTGAAYVPIDPGYPQERIQCIVQDTQLLLLISQTHLLPLFSEMQTPIYCMDAAWPVLLQPRGRTERVDPDALAYVLYTSGSTGTPRGVMISHRAIVNRLRWGREDVDLCAADRVVCLASLSFDISLWEIFGPLMVGAVVVVVGEDGVRDGVSLCDLLAHQQITIAHFLPSLLNVLLQETHPASWAQLRCILCGGEALSVALVQRVFERLHLPLHQFYGPTEASISATGWTGSPGIPLPFVPLGEPITNMQVYLLDPLLQPVPHGVPADVYLGGSGLAWGYLGQPDLTAQRFLPDPFSQQPGSRLYRTGDLARSHHDGALEFLGRGDQQVKVRGHRIELGEIDAALCTHPAIREGVVLAPATATGDRTLVAYVVATPGPTSSDLRGFLRKKVPEYMVPSTFVFLETLPLTTTGKINRLALPAPERPPRASDQAYQAPHTELEQLVATTWQDVLQVDHVGRDDNFFELGGHSLLMIRVQSQLQSRLGTGIAIVALFQYPTVRLLARHLAGQTLPTTQAAAQHQERRRAEARHDLLQEQRAVRRRQRTGQQESVAGDGS